MKTILAFVMSASAVLGCATAGGGGAGYRAPMAPETATAADQQKWDPKAVAVIDQMVAALGGEAAWSGVGEVQMMAGFNDGEKRILSARHWWDRATGRHRYDLERVGDPAFYVCHRIDNALQGKGYLRLGGVQDSKNTKSQAVATSQYEKVRAIAIAAFRRELFWLTAPYRLKSAGAELRLVPDQQGPDGKAYEVVEAAFSGAEWRPMERYQFFIDSATHLPAHVLIFEPGKDKASAGYTLGAWKQVGPVKVATEWKSLNGKQTVTFDNLSFEPRSTEDAIYMPWM